MADPARVLARHTLVFVGGLHRSGTTLVARCLGAHPGVSGFSGTGVYEDEGEHLQSVYPDSWELGGVGRFGFAPAAHITESSPLISEGSRETLWKEWSRWWDLDRRVLVEKSPPNLLKMRFLQALFPDARFVLVVRHPVAVAGAMLKWEPRLVRQLAPHRLIRHWIRCHHVALGDAPHIRRLYVLHYEDLVADAPGELAALREFLGLEGEIPAPAIESGSNQRYLELWAELRRARLRRPYIEWIESRLGPAVQRLGYSFNRLDPVARMEAISADRGASAAGAGFTGRGTRQRLALQQRGRDRSARVRTR
jgi:Sulfotransferase family